MANKDNTVEGVIGQIEKLLARVGRAVKSVCGHAEDEQAEIDLAYLRSAFGTTTGAFPRLNERLLWLSDKLAPAERKRVRSQAAGFRHTFKAFKTEFLETLPDERDSLKPPAAPIEGSAGHLGPAELNQIKQAVHGGGRPRRKPAFTQKAVAVLLGLKSGDKTVANWENGRTKAPLNYTKELRIEGGKDFFDFIAEYGRVNGVNQNLKNYLEGKVVYIEGLTEEQIGRVQEFARQLAQLRYS